MKIMEVRQKEQQEMIELLQRKVQRLEMAYAGPNKEGPPRIPLTPRPPVLRDMGLGSDPEMPEIGG